MTGSQDGKGPHEFLRGLMDAAVQSTGEGPYIDAQAAGNYLKESVSRHLMAAACWDGLLARAERHMQQGEREEARNLFPLMFVLAFGIQGGEMEGEFTNDANRLARWAGVEVMQKKPQAEYSTRQAKCSLCERDCQVICRQEPRRLWCIEAAERSGTAHGLRGGICYPCWRKWGEGQEEGTPFVCFDCAERKPVPSEHRIMDQNRSGDFGEYVYACPTCGDVLREGPRQPPNYEDIP